MTSLHVTTTALLSYVHECQEALDNGVEACSVFFDLCKGFDSTTSAQIIPSPSKSIIFSKVDAQ